MGGCSASKFADHDYSRSDVVSLCRDRKHLLKTAIDRRYTLADSYCKYIHSLYSVAAAIRLFVSCHTSPSSSFLVTLPPPISSSSAASPLPSFSKHSLPPPLSSDSTQAPPIGISCSSSVSTSSSSEDEEVAEAGGVEVEEEEREGQRHEEGGGYVFRDMGFASPPMPSPARDFGWDFFNPFEGVRAESSSVSSSMMMMGRSSRSWDEDLRAVREQEGIPELEEDVEADEEEDVEKDRKVVVGVEDKNGVIEQQQQQHQRQQKGLTIIETPARERELMEALKDVEDHFIRAYDSGKDVSRMLEANRVHLQSGLDEIKGGAGATHALISLSELAFFEED